jgi:hypothetical protein
MHAGARRIGTTINIPPRIQACAIKLFRTVSAVYKFSNDTG